MDHICIYIKTLILYKAPKEGIMSVSVLLVEQCNQHQGKVGIRLIVLYLTEILMLVRNSYKHFDSDYGFND